MMRSDDDVVREVSVDISAPKTEKTFVFEDPMAQGPEFFKGVTGLSQYTKRRFSKAAASSTSAEIAFNNQTGYGILNLAEPPYNLDELSTYYDTSPANHAAIVAKVSNIVGLGYSFVTSEMAAEKLQAAEGAAADKTAKKIDRIKVEMGKWLENLNDEETFQHTLEKVATDFEVFGNGYFEVGRTVTGQIGYLGHIPASTIRVRRKKDGYIQMIGSHITYFRNFGEKTPSPLTNDPTPNEIIHIKKYSPRSTYYGVPDAVAAATAIVGDALASQYNVKYFDNSATPRYIVTLSGGRLSKPAEDKLFKFLQTSLRGQPHRTLFMPLPLDMNGNPVKLEMHRVDDETTDGSWENYRERNKQDILLAHAVPLSRTGGGNEQGVADSLSSDRMFKEQVVVPTQMIFEKAINRIISEKTDIVTFDLNELSLIDELAQSQIIERYIRNQVMMINEGRDAIGLPNIPEGDKFFEPKPQTTAEQNAQAGGTRSRDKERTANNSDSSTTISGRNPKGAGSKE
jgi:PBSX family phage portal protein